MSGTLFRHPLIKIGIGVLFAALVTGLIKVQIVPDDRTGVTVTQALSSLQFFLGWIGIGTVLIGIWRADFSASPTVPGDGSEAALSDFERFLKGDPARKFLSPIDQHKSYEAWLASQKKNTD
ncbi:MAG: hypothetical protein AAGJ79_05090 [Verrucomicrobiota bacterium]